MSKLISQRAPRKAPVAAGGKDSRRATAGVCLLLAAITFAVFGQTLTHDFVGYDDNEYVYENPVVTSGLTVKGLIWAFTHFYSANWHPLTWISHMMDCQLYGLNPAGHHLTNVLLHGATAILLFHVLRQMTGGFWPSAFVAAVFAIHPLRVESVAWVAERKDVLSGLLFVLTIGAYASYARHSWSLARYALVVVLFAMGLMAKPMLVTVPLVLLLLDYWPLRRGEPFRRLIIEKIPLLALSAGACVVTIFAQQGAIQSGTAFTLPLRLENAAVTYMVYLGQMVWPVWLAVYYPYSYHGLPWWELVLAASVLGGFTIVALWQRLKRPWILAGWLWYLVMLLPVIGLIQVGGQSHADRYTYLPQIGIYVALTWVAAEWAAKLRVDRKVVGGLMGLVLGALLICSFVQATYWKNSETLWRHTLACATHSDPGNGLNLAIIHHNIGNAFRDQGDTDAAITQYEEALQSDPDYVASRIVLAGLLYDAGRSDEAIFHLQKALQIEPNSAQAHNDLGNAFLQKGNLAGAIAQFQQGARFAPSDPWVKNNLAWILATCPEAALRNGTQAVELASAANQLSAGGSPIILHTLAAALAEAGRYSEAVETAQSALLLANSEGKNALAAQLQSEMKLYQADQPLHITGPAHK